MMLRKAAVAAALAVFTMFALGQPAVGKAGKGTAYTATGHYYETCACAVSCPCGTTEFLPTEGHCDALMFFHFDKASVGKTKLDGLNLAVVLKSPQNQKIFDAFFFLSADSFRAEGPS